MCVCVSGYQKIEMENLFVQLSFAVIRRVVADAVMNKFKYIQYKFFCIVNMYAVRGYGC